MVLCQVKCFILRVIYLHILYTHCTNYYHYLPVQMYTDAVPICVYCKHLFSVQYVSIRLYPLYHQDDYSISNTSALLNII